MVLDRLEQGAFRGFSVKKRSFGVPGTAHIFENA